MPPMAPVERVLLPLLAAPSLMPGVELAPAATADELAPPEAEAPLAADDDVVSSSLAQYCSLICNSQGAVERVSRAQQSGQAATDGGTDEVGGLLGDAVRGRHQVGGDLDRHDGRVDDADVLGAVDDEPGVDDTSHVAGHHRACA